MSSINLIVQISPSPPKTNVKIADIIVITADNHPTAYAHL